MEGTSTLGATVVNIVKTIVGAGILGLPYAFGQTGQLLGTLLLVITALAQAFAIHLLSLCVVEARSSGQTCPSYRSLANDAFGGSTVINVLVEACVGFGCFGFGTSYLIVIGGLCPQIVQEFGVTSHALAMPSFWITVFGFCVGLPLFCLKKLDLLKVSSMVGNAGVVFIVVVCCFFAAGGLHAPIPEQKASFLLPAHTNYTTVPGMLEVLSIYVFAFSCAQNIPVFVNELCDATIFRVDMSIAIGVGFCLGLYVLTAVCGSMAFGASVDADLLLSFPQQRNSKEGIVATVARAAIVLNVSGSFPLFMHPVRASISQILFQKPPTELKFCLWATVTGCIFATSWGIAFLVKSLDTMMGFVGGSVGMLIGFSFPGLFYYQLHRKIAVDTGFPEAYNISLQPISPDVRQVGLVQGPAGDNDIGNFNNLPRQGGGLRLGSLLLAVITILLIPILLTTQIIKMFV